MAQITVIEDDISVAKLIEASLTALEHEIHIYEDGISGLEALADTPPDILLLDVNLPGMDGLEIAKTIRNDKMLKALPILMLTAQNDVEYRVKGLEHADDYLSKPFSLPELHARIGALLRRSNFQKQSITHVTDLTGDVVKHYEVESELGRGGMSVVYKAYDVKLERYVALKFLTRQISEGEKSRFIRAAQAAARLQHKNIVSVLTIDETHDGHLFVVMPYVEGKTLESHIKRKQLSLQEVLNYSNQIATSLAYAHEHQVVHRDVKPANIFLTKDNIIKLIDFGIAKLQDMPEDSNLTMPGTLLGTVNYMAPEQVESRNVDQRADLWALGVVMFEMLCGERPFKDDGGVMSTIGSIMTDIPKDIKDLRTDAPEGLEQIILKALAKKADERYQSAEDMLTDLSKLS